MGFNLKARHILLPTKHEAEDVERWLKEGKDFAQLARKYSQCSSSATGGELGELKGKKLDENFLESLESLKPGEVSRVVRTRFGYHLIQRWD